MGWDINSKKMKKGKHRNVTLEHKKWLQAARVELIHHCEKPAIKLDGEGKRKQNRENKQLRPESIRILRHRQYRETAPTGTESEMPALNWELLFYSLRLSMVQSRSQM